MKKLLLTLALCLATLAPVWGAGVLILASSSGGAPPNKTSLDGQALGTTSSGTTATVTLTTTKTGDLIIVCEHSNGNVNTGISDVAALSWSLIGSQVGTQRCWQAYSSGILTADVITLTYNSANVFSSTTAFAINGAPSSSYFDTNVALPGTTTTSTPLTITTSNANDFIFASYALTTSTGSPGAGWTVIPGSGTNFMLVEYQIVTATQSALSATISTGTIKNGIGTGIVSQ